jgi:hypothetical protein
MSTIQGRSDAGSRFGLKAGTGGRASGKPSAGASWSASRGGLRCLLRLRRFVVGHLLRLRRFVSGRFLRLRRFVGGLLLRQLLGHRCGGHLLRQLLGHRCGGHLLRLVRPEKVQDLRWRRLAG